MKKQWYLFKKTFQGGRTWTYKYLEEGEVQDMQEYWGIHSNDGHNYGYTVTSKRKKPTKAFLGKEIVELTEENKHLRSRIKYNKEFISYLKSLA